MDIKLKLKDMVIILLLRLTNSLMHSPVVRQMKPYQAEHTVGQC
ncbi:hypothetical protein HMPREF9952_0790 [Haemophilus pittmaniae HK 85]|uniref:Uncharacterized protein n=1 Tax=Haemophilus pittmaniae HK 85 TaxID=1035188 RepID=F9Q9T7_9PAST|nr:hypothetical protein HMPREF9952_0790 [Haemophilus pittmaniae HK 85]